MWLASCHRILGTVGQDVIDMAMGGAVLEFAVLRVGANL